MSLYQLTRHLAVRGTPCSLRAVNLYTRTALDTDDKFFALAERHRRPSKLLGPLAKRAAEAQILVPPDSQPPPSRTEQKLKRAAQRFFRDTQHPGIAREAPLETALAELHRHLLDLIDENFDPDEFQQGTWQDPRCALETIFRHLQHYIETETRGGSSIDLPALLLHLALRRPQVQLRFEQQPCSLATTHLRSQKIQQNHPGKNRVLVLGDDDMMGLTLALGNPDYEVDIFEIDRDLIAFMQPLLPDNASIHQRDLTHGLPQEYHQRYQVVVTDPMYLSEGIQLFVRCCSQGLTEEGRVYLSTCPEMLEDADAFFAALKSNALNVVERLPYFNRYPAPRSALEGALATVAALGLPDYLARAFMDIPYLYADLFVCAKL